MVSFKHFIERLTNAMLSSHNYPQQVFLQDPFTRSKVRRCLQGSSVMVTSFISSYHACLSYLIMVLVLLVLVLSLFFIYGCGLVSS